MVKKSFFEKKKKKFLNALPQEIHSLVHVLTKFSC